VGFATFFLNRCNRSGILDANPIGGIEQTGKYKMDCRFNKDNLKKTLFKIFEKRQQIRVFNEDAKLFLPKIDQYNNVLFNIDPPYFSAGPLLYKNNFKEKDHRELYQAVKELKNRWIMTYDNEDVIRDIYKDYLVREYSLRYHLSQKREATELIIYDKWFVDPLAV